MDVSKTIAPLRMNLAPARKGLALSDCQFYHTMDLPGCGVVQAPDSKWDLRPHLDDIFHGIDFTNKRVIEVGPASGHLTFEMERRGADVLSVETAPDHEWDVIPFPGHRQMWGKASQDTWTKITNGWWFAHERMNSKANVCYLSAHGITEDSVGLADISLLANVLLHNRDPLRMLTRTADVTKKTVVIVEQWQDNMEATGEPLVRLDAKPENPANWNVWWYFTTKYFANFLTVMGFTEISIHRYVIQWGNVPIKYFTLTATRP